MLQGLSTFPHFISCQYLLNYPHTNVNIGEFAVYSRRSGTILFSVLHAALVSVYPVYLQALLGESL